MDLDKAFSYAILTGGKAKLSEVMACGFKKDRLIGEGRKVYDEILAYLTEFDDLPSLQMIQAKTGVALDHVSEPAEFWARELTGRDIFLGVQSAIAETSKVLQSRDPWAALTMLADLTNQIQQNNVVSTSLESLPALSRAALDWYDRIKAGERGIQTPWPTINEATMGLWPEDFVLFVARGGVGKSNASILIAMTAWQQGKKVLFLTTEMAKVTIARRFTAFNLKLPYSRVTSGRLSPVEEMKWRGALDEYDKDERWKIVGGDFDYHVGTLWALVDSFEPDLVVIDGMYLLKTDDRSEKKNDRAASVYDEVKKGAKRFKVPIVSTTQFNRTVKSGARDADIAAIAQTDASGWNADIAFALSQDGPMKTAHRMIVHPMKMREGHMEDFECNWNFETMDFSELPKGSNGHPPGGPRPSPGSGGGPNGAPHLRVVPNNDDQGSLF